MCIFKFLKNNGDATLGRYSYEYGILKRTARARPLVGCLQPTALSRPLDIYTLSLRVFKFYLSTTTNFHCIYLFIF